MSRVEGVKPNSVPKNRVDTSVYPYSVYGDFFIDSAWSVKARWFFNKVCAQNGEGRKIFRRYSFGLALMSGEIAGF